VSATGEWALVIVAGAVLIMAAVQVGAIVVGIRLARRLEERVSDLGRQLDEEVKPLVANLTAMTSEAARAAALASRQVERFDRVFGELVERADETLQVAQQLVTGPARRGMAILAGIKAAFDAFRGFREAGRRPKATRPVTVEDEESLFIG
jgi:type IV secretory pathway VirB2 component (pilin)